jgi:chromatin remodeling complex protein RSC6
LKQIPKTMRIWISNNVEDQIWQGNGFNVDSFDFTPSMEASYRVKIEGRLLDDDESPSTSAEDQTSSTGNATAVGSTTHDGAGGNSNPKSRLSNFFKAISIEFDASRFRDGTEQNIEWKKPDSAGRSHPDKDIASGANFDELTFKRNGDENANITVLLHRQETPQRYELSPELADVVDMSEATQQEAVMGLWEYVRLSGLQEDEEKRNFRCDDALRKVRRHDG